MGFEEAAQRVALYCRVAPTLKDGRPAAGKWVRLNVAFRVPGD